MKSKVGWALLFSLLALLLRLNLALNGPMEWDESVYTESAARLSQAIRAGDWSAILDSTDNIEHPQWNKLVYAVVLLPFNPISLPVSFRAADSIRSISYWPKIVALRLVSVVFGVAAVFLLSLIHPLAGLFLAVQTLAVKYTSVVYLDSLPAFAVLCALFAANRALDHFTSPTHAVNSRAGWKCLILSALFLGMAVASKYMFGVVGLVIVGLALARGWKAGSRLLLALAGWAGLCLLFFFLFDPILWHAPLQRLQQSFQFNLDYSLSQHVTVEAHYPFWQPLFWLMLSLPQHSPSLNAFFQEPGNYVIVLDSLIFLFAIVGLPSFFRANKAFFAWLVVGFAFLLVWNTKWPQYVLLVLPPFCLAAAYGLDFVRRRYPWR